MRRLLAAVAILFSLPGCNRPPAKTATAPPVWVINGFDVPLNVTVAGESVTVSGRSKKNLATTAFDLEFVATTTDGREVDRAQVFRKYEHRIAYNILGAAPLLFGKEIYVPESRKHIPVPGGGGGSTSYLEKVIERPGIDFFLEHPPSTIKVAKDERDEVWKASVRVKGGWKDTLKFLQAEGRTGEAEDFAATVAEVHQPARGTKVVEALPERKRQPAAEAPKPLPLLWAERSGDGRARVEQRPAGEGTCNTTCTIGTSAAWTVNECLGNNGPLRFISNDCRRLVVVRVVGEDSWEYSPVVFIYSEGQLDKTMTAGDFITEDSAVVTADDSFTWLSGPARLSADGIYVEFNTSDGRGHRLSLR